MSGAPEWNLRVENLFDKLCETVFEIAFNVGVCYLIPLCVSHFAAVVGFEQFGHPNYVGQQWLLRPFGFGQNHAIDKCLKDRL